jgi:NAD(P)-dependent dehydrogenase (short-subunit alcohol dehydrogenase family)
MTSSRTWLVTGCSSGFGRALAENILASGDNLLATVRNPAALSDLVSQYPDACRVFTLDMTRPDQIAQAIPEAAKAFGRIDVVVSNAGYGLVGALEEYSDDQIEKNIATNLTGPLHLFRAVLPVLRSQKSGHLIHMSAIAAFNNELGFSVYGAAKAGMEAACEALRGEVSVHGIKVTLVLPGPFRTNFIATGLERATTHLTEYDATSGKFVKFLESINGKQPGDPDKAALAILNLVREGKAPMRLVLGKYAIEKVRRKLLTVERELQEFESVALATDFTD